MKFGQIASIAGAAILCGGSVSSAAIFADFNVNEGPFGFAPGFSGSSVGESATSTADRVTTGGPLEGTGHQQLNLVHDGSTTNMRIRHLTGTSPFGSAQAGLPTSQTIFTTSSETDGYIGFYLKMDADPANTGWTVALNLDDSTNTAVGMDGGNAKPFVADGTWKLFEWNLDDDNDWGAVTGIGGDGTIQNGQHSIDSIYITTNQTSTTAGTTARTPLYLDFVAKSDSGSIATLVPEPTSLALLGLVGASVLSRRRRV